jgi:hypothetical protein
VIAGQLVLIAGVDHVAGGVATHAVSGVALVGILNRFVLDNRDDLLHKVRKLDNRADDGLGDEAALMFRRLAWSVQIRGHPPLTDHHTLGDRVYQRQTMASFFARPRIDAADEPKSGG